MAQSTSYSPAVRKDRNKNYDAVGTIPSVAGLSVEEFGYGIVRQTVLTFNDMSVTIADTGAIGSQKIYDFPLGRIHVIGCVARIVPTTTSTIASTLNSGATVSWGVGSAAASSNTLATTMMNFMPGSGESVNNFTSSTTINVAASADTGFLAAVAAAQIAAVVDGTATAADCYLNFGVPTDTQIDADATIAVDGHVILTWINEGVIDALT